MAVEWERIPDGVPEDFRATRSWGAARAIALADEPGKKKQDTKRSGAA
jgi:hypothetical protein